MTPQLCHLDETSTVMNEVLVWLRNLRKQPLGRSIRRWKDIKIDLRREIVRMGDNWLSFMFNGRLWY
jgi:hypothetical protein